ncbi:MAG TPA: S46 family peptidase [Alphaproteobacteria bacterium]|nr:S46 family peptidase [Alphaproteobacteria bacterium]
MLKSLFRLSPALTAATLLLAPSLAQADEGMWTFNNFPAGKVSQAYGFAPDQKWLDHVQLSSIRLARGCSGSLVSKDGLVMTNHHCAHSCIEQLSTKDRDFVQTGFYAKESKDEVKCPDMEANQLVQISDVTVRVKAAIAGKDGKDYSDALRAVEADIAKECVGGKGDTLRCDVVDLYHGGIYNLYKYRRYQDLRLVFAPEFAIAFFGGDPDNFEFPRYDLDVSFVRIYDNGKPLDSSANYLPFAKEDAKDGDLTFVSGHPGSTERLETVAELEYARDVRIPNRLFYLAELRGVLEQFSQQGPEQHRIADSKLFFTENSYKALKGQFEALTAPALIKAKHDEEAVLKAKIDGDPQMKAEFGGVWDTIKAAVEHTKLIADRYAMLEAGRGLDAESFRAARYLVRYAAESAKPDGERLREYTDANFPAIRQTLTSKAPIYPEFDKTTLRFSLTVLQRLLGPDDATVKKLLGSKSPAELATELVEKTTLKDLSVRQKLLEGGAAAINASKDPMIQFARLVDGDARAVRKDFEENVDAPLTKASGMLAQARFKQYGTSVDPDATFTLRLSYGAVKGYDQKGGHVTPFTTIAGAFARATGAEPFKLPESWLAAKNKINLDQKLNFCTTNDIIGGNSGSPVINKNAEVVGLIFDGNIQSLGGDFGFDPVVNRAVAVNSGALREALAKIYHADRIVAELAR